jgi:hypothetical protein
MKAGRTARRRCSSGKIQAITGSSWKADASAWASRGTSARGCFANRRPSRHSRLPSPGTNRTSVSYRSRHLVVLQVEAFERIPLPPRSLVTWGNAGPHSAEPSIPDKDEAAGSSPARPTTVDDQRNAGHRARRFVGGGMPDQERLPGYLSWSWTWCSKSPHRPIERQPAARTARADHRRPVALAVQLTTGRSGAPRWSCAGRCALGSPAAPRPCPVGPPVRGVRWVRAMRLRLGRARLLGGFVGAWQPGQGR